MVNTLANTNPMVTPNKPPIIMAKIVTRMVFIIALKTDSLKNFAYTQAIATIVMMKEIVPCQKSPFGNKTIKIKGHATASENP